MSTPVIYNSVTYNVPAFGDTGYAQGAGNLSSYLIALATGSLNRSGGSFILTNDVNFGSTFGLLADYFTSITANPATAGRFRLAAVDTIDWRNNANSANLALGINGADALTFNGTALQPAGNYITDLTGDVTASGPGSVPATLATVNGNVGSFTNATITVNAKGLITAAANGSGGVFTPANLTDAGTDGIVITGGTNAVNGSGTSIAQHVADASHNGYLSSTDWTTFNSASNPLTTPLTGFTRVSGVVTSADTILSGIEKSYTNQALNIPLVVTLASLGTVTPDASTGSLFYSNLAGNLTINGPINPSDGQKIMFRLRQPFVSPGGGGYSTTFVTGTNNFQFGTTVPSFTNSDGGNQVDYVGAVWDAPNSHWDIVSISNGFPI